MSYQLDHDLIIEVKAVKDDENKENLIFNSKKWKR